jgi:hypothetical protein
MSVHCESHAGTLALIADSDLLGVVPVQDLQAGVAAGRLQRVDTPLSSAAQCMLQAITMAARSLRNDG